MTKHSSISQCKSLLDELRLFNLVQNRHGQVSYGDFAFAVGVKNELIGA